MGIENVKESLIQEANGEARKIIAQANSEAGQIEAAAKAKAREISSEAKKKAEEIIASQRSERISAANLKAKKVVSQAREEAAQKALAQIWAAVKELPKSGEYEKIMGKFISEGIEELGKDAIVQTNAADAKIAKKFHANMAPQNAHIAGGAIVMSKDKNVFVDNSLESLFNSRKDAIKMLIYSELLGGSSR